MQDLAKQLNKTTQQQWYNVSTSSLIENGGAPLLHRYKGSRIVMMKSVFPEYPRVYQMY